MLWVLHGVLQILATRAVTWNVSKNEVDPLTCPKCKNKMRILAFIEDQDVIKKILKHLGLWDQKARPPHFRIDYSHRDVGPYGPEADSQAPPSDDYLFHDPEYPIEAYTRRI